MRCTDPRHKHSTPERSAACADKAFRAKRKKAPPVFKQKPREAKRGPVTIYVWSESSATRY